jgi:hypothetical protein
MGEMNKLPLSSPLGEMPLKGVGADCQKYYLLCVCPYKREEHIEVHLWQVYPYKQWANYKDTKLTIRIFRTS